MFVYTYTPKGLVVSSLMSWAKAPLFTSEGDTVANALNKVVMNGMQQTKQTVRADERQERNSAGGYTFVASDQARLERFLVLGTDGGTYYVGESQLTADNAKFLVELIQRDGGKAVVETATEISTSGRAPKNDAAIFALALVLNFGDDAGKQAAKLAVNKVVRTGTHLFMFVDFLKNLGGIGRAKKNAIAGWYTGKSTEQVGFQAAKYRSRYGYTHRDALRISHPKGLDRDVTGWILGGEYDEAALPDVVKTLLAAQRIDNERDMVELIEGSETFFWEMMPTSLHSSAAVWKAIFYKGMGQIALVRNLARFQRLELFNDFKFTADVADQLANEEAIRKSRIHPVQYLTVLAQATANHIGAMHCSKIKSITLDGAIVAALEKGVEVAYGNVEPSGKNTLIGLDVSGSMGWNAAGNSSLSAASAGAAVALIMAKTEKYAKVFGFAGTFRDLGIGAGDSFTGAMVKAGNQAFGSTDCAQPMIYALRHKMDVDTFVVITDNETWSGSVHPHEALRRYNKAMGKDAKMVVVAMTATRETIAEPGNPNMLDISGFDATIPQLVANFSAGRI